MNAEELLNQIPLLSSLPLEVRNHLLEHSLVEDIPAGTILVREGDLGDSFYILLAGEVDVFKALDTEDERHLARRGPGSFIGEMGLLIRDQRRTASVIAFSPLTLLKFTHEDFDALLQRWPTLAVELLREVSMRLRETDNATIRDLQEKNIELAKAYRELELAQEQIVQKEILERELLMARKIQDSILPRQLPTAEGYAFGARIEPARAVGGDFYDFIRLDNSRFGIVIGDISDKGVPAAIFMALTRSLVRAKATRRASAEQVLMRVNELLLEMNSEGMFATVLYGILDTERRNFAYARAGHEIPILIDARGQAILLPKESGQPVGLFSCIYIDRQTVEISPGSTLFLYTDGAPDALAPSGEHLGMHGLMDGLKRLGKRPAQELCDGFIQMISDFRGPEPQTDDIGLIAIQAV